MADFEDEMAEIRDSALRVKDDVGDAADIETCLISIAVSLRRIANSLAMIEAERNG